MVQLVGALERELLVNLTTRDFLMPEAIGEFLFMLELEIVTSGCTYNYIINDIHGQLIYCHGCTM